MLSSIVMYPPYASKRDIIHTCTGVDLRKKINWPNGPVKFLNIWPLQNSTGLRNIGPGSGLI